MGSGKIIPAVAFSEKYTRGAIANPYGVQSNSISDEYALEHNLAKKCEGGCNNIIAIQFLRTIKDKEYCPICHPKHT